MPLENAEQVPDPNSGEVAAGAHLDRQLIAGAFGTLPDRWQQVLWYSEVEALKPRDIAPRLGMSANSVSALIYRAKEALRQAWIQTHLVALPVESEHRWTIEHLGSYSRQKLGDRDRVKVETHLRDCKPCTKVASEARRIATVLPWALLPLVGSLSAAAQASAATTPPSAVAASRKSLPARAAQTLEGMARGPRRLVLAGTATVASVALAGTVAALVLFPDAHSPAPVPVLTQAAEQITPANVATALSTEAPATKPTRPGADPNLLNPQPIPPAGDSKQPDAGPPPEVVDTIPSPVISQIDTGNGLWFPIVSGTALPGALVTVSNGSDLPMQATAGPSGEWATMQLTGFGPGTHELTAQQTTASGLSSAPAVEAFTIADPPEFGARGGGYSLYVVLTGQQETTAQVVDQTGLTRGELSLVIAGRGGYRWEGLFPEWSTTAGTQSVSARYGSGERWGPAVTVTVEISDPNTN